MPEYPLFRYYKEGQYAETWTQLLSKGVHVRQEPLYSEALQVARETMTRVKENIEQLVQKLHQIEYEFLYPDEIYVPPALDVSDKLDELEKLTGLLPLSVRVWYEVVGSVNFIGSYPNFNNLDQDKYLPFDPLVVIPLEQAFIEFEQWHEIVEEDSLEKTGPFLMPLAPDDYHKDDTSGGPPYEIELPNSEVDALLLNEWHHTTFVNYLRICFKWGGFPGFERYKIHPEELRFLVEGLRPI